MPTVFILLQCKLKIRQSSKAPAEATEESLSLIDSVADDSSFPLIKLKMGQSRYVSQKSQHSNWSSGLALLILQGGYCGDIAAV